MSMRKTLINKYFDLIGRKDFRGILDLFTDTDPVVYEPFSNEKDGLHGKNVIESFLRVAVMANDGLKRQIRIIDGAARHNKDTVTTLVTFERGSTLQGRFSFSFVAEPGPAKAKDGKDDGHIKIKSLRIRFI
jgi:hypothetical protein